MRSPRTKPRKQRSPADIERLVNAYHTSGLTQRAFARRRGLSPATLSYWLRRGKSKGKTRSMPSEPTLVPVEVVDAPAGVGEPFEIVLANDRIVRVVPSFDEGALRRLLSVVEG